MQLGFDRQHFTLPRVGIFFGLNKGRPSRVTRSTKPWDSVQFLFEFVVKGLVTDQFHLVRKIGKAPTPGCLENLTARSTPDLLISSLIKAEQRREFSAGDCR
ncbi:hypothetical protein EVS84_03765 [Pseudomonas koreensis]|uniref:Uncharacterized protein n=1 Tax=Pseudomonas koreensis TaxID=198620 RepID=A0A4Q4LE14_9PSED|nr:hypothetical protein EVS84_03765 [Pseudomonas koreensis]